MRSTPEKDAALRRRLVEAVERFDAGWQIDHREALICGGRDAVDNMQWLTIEEHKAKTRVEVKLCRPHRPPSTSGVSRSP